MIGLRSLTALLGILLLTACTTHNRDYYTATADVGLYGEDLHRNLGPHGDKHVRRGEYIVDVGSLTPEPGESYELFSERVTNTLTIQEYDIQMLEEAIASKSKQIDYLEDQLEQLQKENAGLRTEVKTSKQTVVHKPRIEGDAIEKYIVQKGDTLQKIAHRKFGSYTAWLTLYRFNLPRLPHGPNRIDEGQLLLIPNEESFHAHFQT